MMLARSFWLLATIAFLASARSGVPVNYGLVLYPGFAVLDVFGPIDVLNGVYASHDINLSIIAPTLAPVTAGTHNSTYNPTGSTFELTQTVNPTHTFAHPPKELDVLLVPGGDGSLYDSPALLEAIAYIKKEYPRLQYIFSVCTGSTLLARAGVLDGKKATTNKAVWKWATSQGPRVDWVPVARWVVDGNIWTTSGVAAGLDGAFAFIGMLYGPEFATQRANYIEYVRDTNSTNDPFAAIWNVTGSS